MMRSLSLRSRLEMASSRASGLAARLEEVERERLPEDRLPDEAERDEPERAELERDEPERDDVDRDELDRDALEEDREPELLRVPEPEREDVLRPLELPPLALVLRERVEREDDEPELLEPEEPLELEVPRLGCGIELSPCTWGCYRGTLLISAPDAHKHRPVRTGRCA